MKWDSTVGWEGEGVVGGEGEGVGEDGVKKLQISILDPMELVVIIIYWKRGFYLSNLYRINLLSLTGRKKKRFGIVQWLGGSGFRLYDEILTCDLACEQAPKWSGAKEKIGDAQLSSLTDFRFRLTPLESLFAG